MNQVFEASWAMYEIVFYPQLPLGDNEANSISLFFLLIIHESVLWCLVFYNIHLHIFLVI